MHNQEDPGFKEISDTTIDSRTNPAHSNKDEGDKSGESTANQPVITSTSSDLGGISEQPASERAAMVEIEEGQSSARVVEEEKGALAPVLEETSSEKKRKDEERKGKRRADVVSSDEGNGSESGDEGGDEDVRGKKKKEKRKKERAKARREGELEKEKEKEKKKPRKRKSKKEDSSSGDESSQETSDSESEDEKKITKKRKAKAKPKTKKKKSRKDDVTSEDNSHESESDNKSDKDEKKKRKKKAKAKAALKAKAKSKKAESSGSEFTSDSSDSDADDSPSESEDEKKKRKRKKKKNTKVGTRGKKSKKQDFSSDESSTSSPSASSSSSSSSSDSESESEAEKKKKRKKTKVKPKVTKNKRKTKKDDSSSSPSSSSSSSSCSSDSDSTLPSSPPEDVKKSQKSRMKKKKRKSHRAKKKAKHSSSSSEDEAEDEKKETTESTASTVTNNEDELQSKIQKVVDQLGLMQLQQQQKQTVGIIPAPPEDIKTAEKKSKTGVHEFKRVDQIWDTKNHVYKFTETGKESKDESDCVFSVRRKFDWDQKFQYTMLDIKSNLLRDVLKDILKGIKGVSLVEETPEIHPHMVFLYYDELQVQIKELRRKHKKARKSKEKKRLKQQRDHCKLLADFVDEDYGERRKKLKSMLKAGNITYDLLWALYKPNTIAYTPTYGNKDDPRCFRVDVSYHEEDFLGNEKIVVEGRYLEYDGKIFGLGDHAVRLPSFKGPKKITSLEAYPMKYHKDPEGLRKQLIERGKRFVTLQGMSYRTQKGLAYVKQKRSIVRISVNGRVMIDPAIFRRINPNYPLSYIKQDEVKPNDSDSDSNSDSSDSAANSDSSGDAPPKRLIVWKDKKGRKHLIPVPTNNNPDTPTQKLEPIDKYDGIQHTFTEEELIIASPVVLGFSFSEKYWLEFSLLGLGEIEWNKEAYDSLVLAPKYKQNLKGLVSSHRFNAAKTIDDVIQGKGKGMVVVLHGPPGVGKTLTAESIAEYLRCPLYAVSAGELGTNSRTLEIDLNRIMDITHSWGAILLIDEADVFMEARQAHDIHRNSLVSVFLRLLEYYQGILFLTTNRVETFDEAFQSRIHMGIRYEGLTAQARMEIWKHHISKVVSMEGPEGEPFKDEDIEELSHKVLNGRQIKNTVKTAQSIALSEKEPFATKHIKRVMEVQEAFQEDMRGGGAALAHYI